MIEGSGAASGSVYLVFMDPDLGGPKKYTDPPGSGSATLGFFSRERHEQRHKDNDIFQCEDCNKVFKNEKNLRHHYKAHHENPSPGEVGTGTVGREAVFRICIILSLNLCKRTVADPHTLGYLKDRRQKYEIRQCWRSVPNYFFLIRIRGSVIWIMGPDPGGRLVTDPERDPTWTFLWP